MKWIDKKPPGYVWDGDTWYNEADKKEYKVDVDRSMWVSPDTEMPMPPKTRVYENGRRTR